MIHHWVGTAFVPAATIDEALALLQNYNAHQRIYAPTVAASKLRSRDGDRFTFFLRFVMKKVITVVVNSEHEAVFRQARRRSCRRMDSQHAHRRSRERRAAPTEREKPVGNDGGYLWRLNTYWRLLARDGGLYIHCESVSLSRGIPVGFGWLVGPFVTSIPRESLTFTLETTRQQLDRRPAVDGRWRRSAHERISAAPMSRCCRSSRSSHETRAAFDACSTRAIPFAPRSFLT